ncbi:GerAB/ArcD/ProY family transporter [Paenibacillus sacheonensis]|uniref:GerAB/ArcD/ProY family transporter n=1 Tax=Paenibacillus sacheonensis TaxID=742054 RepID=A0A7X5BZK2_9BACL|nr:GerAB/ArcD/ProY family transporter [Paenibacillus sacheonensis]MBM7566389.1 spore germination protein KB [Paenibacillus sacheonensis]NBC70591.1 GerAB/ArcD/ProY family transporter [Paenibacillus sacheonensis]
MKLTNYQLFWLLFSMEAGMTIMLTLGPTFQAARQGAPLAMLLAGAVSLLATYIAAKLSLLYPEDTFVEYVPKIIGQWLGKTLVFVYLLLWIAVGGIVLREYADFVHMALFDKTPLWAIILFMLIVILYAVHGGIHIVARCSEIIGPIVVFNIILFRIFSLKDLHLDRLLPLLPSDGWMPVLSGSAPAASYMSESVMIVMLIAFIGNKKKTLSSGLWGVGFAAIVLLNVIIDTMMMLGSTVPAMLQYPVYSISQYISVMEFVQNLDIFLVVGMSFTVFVKIGLYLFMTSYGTAQLFGIRNWRRVLWAVSMLVLAVALFPRNADETQVVFPLFWKNIVFPIFLFAVPFLLWMIGSARKRMKRPVRPHA